MKRVLTGAAVLSLAITIAVGLNIWNASGEINSSAITATSTPTPKAEVSQEVGTFQTKLGDCFSTLPTAQGSSMIKSVACTSEHHWQVVFQGELWATSYNAIELQNKANQLCNDAVIRIVKGFTSKSSAIFANASFMGMPATAAAFNKGERGVDCFLGSYFETYSVAIGK
jgi:hypothetical protein